MFIYIAVGIIGFAITCYIIEKLKKCKMCLERETLNSDRLCKYCVDEKAFDKFESDEYHRMNEYD